MITVENVSYSYHQKDATTTLTNVTLSLQEHAVTALVGANGAGKSTLLGIMSNLLQPQQGQVLLGGKPISQYKEKEVAKQIAVLKQTQQLGLRITVQDLIEFGRFPHSGGRLTEEDRQKVAKAMEYLALTNLRGRYLDELSGGQRQRAFIAMILAQDTPYIFLDEPLNNLDIKYSVEIMKIIRQLVDELGKTVIVVLHDINFASAYADQIVVMKNGQIVGEGTPHEMVTKSVLDDVFEHNFHIICHNGQNICLCYDDEIGTSGVAANL